MISYVCEFGDTTLEPTNDPALPPGWSLVNMNVAPPVPVPDQPAPSSVAVGVALVGHVCPNHTPEEIKAAVRIRA